MIKWGELGPETGNLADHLPGLDADVTVPEAVDAIVELARDWFDGEGEIIVRVGNAPKVLIPFRTSEPFRKFAARFVDPHGRNQKIEFLGEGQQYIIDGTNPDSGTRYAYRCAPHPARGSKC